MRTDSFLGKLILYCEKRAAERSSWVGGTLLITSLTGTHFPEWLVAALQTAGPYIACALIFATTGEDTKPNA